MSMILKVLGFMAQWDKHLYIPAPSHTHNEEVAKVIREAEIVRGTWLSLLKYLIVISILAFSNQTPHLPSKSFPPLPYLY